MLDPELEASGLGPSPFSQALADDWAALGARIEQEVRGASVLVVGAAGTVGQAATRALLAFGPARLELIDIDENGLARLARDIRSRSAAGSATAVGFNALDFGAPAARGLLRASGPFDLVLDFAAVKHVRSEKNRFTLAHMLDVNVVRQRRFARWIAAERLARRCFVVSTDKAADPASFMGASKLLMEHAVFAETAAGPPTSAARFANVAFSSGSLLESYLQRFAAGQALAAPRATRRHFISAGDAARICLLAAAVCPPGAVAVPKIDPAWSATELCETAAAFLTSRGRRAVFAETAEEAAAVLAGAGADYPVLLTPRDTAGEKEVEVFRGAGESVVDLGLSALEAVRHAPVDAKRLAAALEQLADFVAADETPDPEAVRRLIADLLPGFRHMEGEAALDDRV